MYPFEALTSIFVFQAASAGSTPTLSTVAATPSVRYNHQVGNQIITLTPQQQLQQQPSQQQQPQAPSQQQQPKHTSQQQSHSVTSQVPTTQVQQPVQIQQSQQQPPQQTSQLSSQQQPQGLATTPALQQQFKPTKSQDQSKPQVESQRVLPEQSRDPSKQPSYQQSFPSNQQQFSQFPQDIESQVQSCINSLDNSFLDLQSESQIIQQLQQSPSSPLSQMNQSKLLSPCQPSQTSPILPHHQDSSQHLSVPQIQVHHSGMSMPSLHSPQLPSVTQPGLSSPPPQPTQSQAVSPQVMRPQGLLLAQQPPPSQHSSVPILRADPGSSDKGSPTFGSSTLCDASQFSTSVSSSDRCTSPIHVVSLKGIIFVFCGVKYYPFNCWFESVFRFSTPQIQQPRHLKVPPIAPIFDLYQFLLVV